MAATLKKAWEAFEKGETERATTLFAELTTKDVASAHPHTQEGLFFLRIGRYEAACASFTKATEAEEKNPAPIFFLALAQELAGKTGDSERTLEKLSVVSPHHQGRSSLRLLSELRHGNPVSLLAEFGFGPKDPARPPASLSHRVAASLGRGNPEWLPSDLSSSDYLLGPILLEVEAKLHPLEIPKLEHHPPLLPEDPDSMREGKRSLREELSQLKNSFKAGSAMKKGRRYLEKGFSTADRADRDEQRKLLNKAVLYLRSARKLDPYTFRVSYHLAEAYIFLSKREPGRPFDRLRLLQAQASLLESARKEGVNPYLLFYLAYTQHLLGRPKLAIEYYRAATKKFEKLPEAHYGEGQCHLLLGDREAAQELMLKAANSDLALARERLDTFAKLIAERGPEFFDRPFPVMPDEPSPPEPAPAAEAPPGEPPPA